MLLFRFSPKILMINENYTKYLKRYKRSKNIVFEIKFVECME